MYQKMFNLKEKPFHITPNPRFIFLSKNHKEAFAHLLYGVRQRVGFLSLIGEVGTGKTTVLRTLLQQLRESDYQVALIFNPCLSALELLQSIHREFNIPCPVAADNLARLHASLNSFLLDQRKLGKTVVLVIDEAQNLEPLVLEQLRLLSNLETETDKLLQLIIVGQPELEEILGRRELRQLKQRLTVRYRLTSMDLEDTVAYIKHRLKIAGFTGGELFSQKALRRIFRLTAGLPRLINILCDRALLLAYASDQQFIDQRLVKRAQAELVGLRSSPASRRLWLTAATLVGFGFLLLLYQQPAFMPEVQDVQTQRAASTSPIVEKAVIIDLRDLERVKQQLAALSPDRSLELATKALLKRWKPLGTNRDRSEPLASPGRILADQGLEIVRFQGSSDKLLGLNSPAILPIVLPNLQGKRYLALLEARDGRVLLAPALSDDGWLPLAWLDEIWFGKAVIPWLNYEQLPFLVSSGTRVEGVARIQRLLVALGYPDLEVSGTYDRDTINAVADFQRLHGLAADGRVGAQTLLQIYHLSGFAMPHLQEGPQS